MDAQKTLSNVLTHLDNASKEIQGLDEVDIPLQVQLSVSRLRLKIATSMKDALNLQKKLKKL